jgi:repressor LexA
MYSKRLLSPEVLVKETPKHVRQGIRRRAEMLHFLAQKVGGGEAPPTVRELGAAVGLSSTKSAHDHLKKLEAEGYVERSSPTGSRSMRLTEKGWEAVGRVPMMGRIAAGRGLEAVPTEGESYSLPAELLRARSGRRRYTLRVVGHSMTGARIEDGDLLVVEEDEDPPDGSVVVALLEDGDEVTVKRLYRAGNMVRLVPHNGDHREIVVSAEAVRVQGTVVYVVHPPTS